MMHGFESQGIPAVPAFIAIVAAFFGGMGLIGEFAQRALNELDRPAEGEGIEFHLLVLAITISIMIVGADAFSVDGTVGTFAWFWTDFIKPPAIQILADQRQTYGPLPLRRRTCASISRAETRGRSNRSSHNGRR